MLTAGVLLVACAVDVEAQEAQTTSKPLSQLREWLNKTSLSSKTLPSLVAEPFAKMGLTKSEAETAAAELWGNRREALRAERAAEMEASLITLGDKSMPFWFKVFGEQPEGGRSLFISMHGGGGAPTRVNDQQYENQKRLYKPAEGVYLVPRAPTDAWNLWHQSHIDDFFDRLITNMVVFENVNPYRVYVMGYSAGGDGVYQLAPRMADRWAAASMMAGHPNETQPDGLRNIGFTLHMGAEDSAYNRNRIAGEWKEKLAALQQSDPDGYVHYVELHTGRAHWMNLEDAVAVPWMAKFNRQRFPGKIVWKQDDVVHNRFYWLQVAPESAKGGQKIVAKVDGNNITIDECPEGRLTVLLHDDLVDMDSMVNISSTKSSLFEGTVPRTIESISRSLLDRDEPGSVVYGQISVDVLAAE